MVDQYDIYLCVKINYPSNPIKEIRTKDLPSLDWLKNKIMEKLAIPNTKDYLYLSCKDDKGTVQKIEDKTNIFDYAKEKPKSHQTEYILEFDLSISDEVEKFKKFFKEGFDDNKHIKEMEKKIITKEKNENLQKELLKKDIENKRLNNYIKVLQQKIKEQTNKFFEDIIQILEIEEKKILDDIKNKDDAFKNFRTQILKYFKDLKEGKKELNEQNIKLKSTPQKIEKDSDKDKITNSSSKKGSEMKNLILKEKDGSNSKVINNNKQSDNNISMPLDNLGYKKINSFGNKNINPEQFQNDEFFKFLNEYFFNNEYLSSQDKNFLKKYNSELQNSKESMLKKWDYFDVNIITPKLISKETNIQYKNKLISKKNELEKFLKCLKIENQNPETISINNKNNNIYKKEINQIVNDKRPYTYYPNCQQNVDKFINSSSNKNNNHNFINEKSANKNLNSFINKNPDNRKYSSNDSNLKYDDYNKIGQNNIYNRTYYNYHY
jgi:hypothetical protein